MHLWDQNMQAKEHNELLNLWRQASTEINVSGQPPTSVISSGNGGLTPAYDPNVAGEGQQCPADHQVGTLHTFDNFPDDDDTINSFTQSNNPSSNSLHNITCRLVDQATLETECETFCPQPAIDSYNLKSLFNFSDPFWTEKVIRGDGQIVNEINPVLNGY